MSSNSCDDGDVATHDFASPDGPVLRLHERTARHDEAIGQQAVTLARHDEKINALDAAVITLSDTVSKGIWALVAFAFTIAAAAVGLAITIASSGGPH